MLGTRPKLPLNAGTIYNLIERVSCFSWIFSWVYGLGISHMSERGIVLIRRSTDKLVSTKKKKKKIINWLKCRVCEVYEVWWAIRVSILCSVAIKFDYMIRLVLSENFLPDHVKRLQLSAWLWYAATVNLSH